MSKGDLAKHKRAVHEGVKYPCGQCNHQATSKGDLARHKRAAHEGVKFPCGNASIKQHQKDILLDTRGQCMNELDSHAVIVINNVHPEIILQSIRNLHL